MTIAPRIPTVAASCTGCGACIPVCAPHALSLSGDTPGQRGSKRAVIDTSLCTGCGVCIPACPRGALSLPVSAPPGNLFGAIPGSLPEELVETLHASAHVRIERIVSRGHASAEGFWYDQEEHEFVVLLSGRARLAFADGTEEIDLAPGDWLDIPAHKKHRVAWTDSERDTVWLAVHYR